MQTEIERRVRFADRDDLDPARMMVRPGPGDLQPGSRVQVELGASSREGNNRTGGLWIECEVVTDSARELVVKVVS